MDVPRVTCMLQKLVNSGPRITLEFLFSRKTGFVRLMGPFCGDSAGVVIHSHRAGT